MPTPPKCNLPPGQTCLFCGHTAPKKEKPVKLTCPGCKKQFRKGDPWRLYFRKRWHVACVEQVQQRAAAGDTTTVADQPTTPAASPPSPPAMEAPTPEEEGLLAQCLEIMREGGKASVSLFQRRLRLTYVKSSRLCDLMAARGWINRRDPATGTAGIEVLALPAKSEEFTCPACDYEKSDGSLIRRCKKCAGKLGFSRRVKSNLSTK
jgi:predicted RNA-binding Zn-ribbon protein involved in translation (DUF1610 family)